MSIKIPQQQLFSASCRGNDWKESHFFYVCYIEDNLMLTIQLEVLASLLCLNPPKNDFCNCLKDAIRTVYICAANEKLQARYLLKPEAETRLFLQPQQLLNNCDS